MNKTIMPKNARSSGRQSSRQRGQSMIEYIVVVAMGVLILIEGGSSAPVMAVAAAIKNAYQGFAYAISLSSDLMVSP